MINYRYRDISIYGKGFAKEWNSHTVFEIKWDANRDPDQKFSVTFKTNTSDIVDGEQFLGLLIIEYPGRIINTDLLLKYMGKKTTIAVVILIMNSRLVSLLSKKKKPD